MRGRSRSTSRLSARRRFALVVVVDEEATHDPDHASAHRRPGRSRRLRPRVRELRAEEQDPRDDVDEEEERHHAGERSVDQVVAREVGEHDGEHFRRSPDPDGREDRTCERAAAAKLPGGNEAVEEQHRDADRDQLDPVAKHEARGCGDVRPLGEAVDELAEEGAERRQPDDQDHEYARGGDEDEVDELRPCRRASAVDLHCGLQPEADRGHHSGRAPQERDERDEPDGRERGRDLLDRLLDVRLPRLRDREEVDQLGGHLLPDLVVLEYEPEDRDEGDRQREEREQHAVRDRRRVLGAAIREHVLDRTRERAGDSANDSAEVLEGSPRESLDPFGGLGGAVAHPTECTEHLPLRTRSGCALRRFALRSHEATEDKRGDRLALPLDTHGRHGLDDRPRSELAKGGLADQHAVHRCRRLEARGEVHDVADDPVFAVAARCSDETRVYLAARHADPKVRPVGMLGGGAPSDALQDERGPRGSEGVIADGGVLPEDDHELVADDLVHVASRALHERDDPPVVRVEHRCDLVRSVPLRIRGVAGEVGEDDAHLAGPGEGLVEVEGAEPLLVPLRPRDERDEQERAEHEHVPLPPGDLPVPSPRDDDHRLREEDEREREREDEPLRASLVEPEEPERRDPVERDTDRGEDELPAVELLGGERIVERRELRKGHRSPDGDDRAEGDE